MSNIHFVQQYGDARIYVKREDLHPFSFGGNKVKIAQELFADMEERGFTSVISFGSPTSNMNRAIAHMAASRGIPCHVVLKREGDISGPVPMNERLVRDSGADVTDCVPDRVRETIEAVMARAAEQGEKPYYIYGDSSGRGNEEVLMRAYGKQWWPIREFQRENGTDFRHIFLPVGTAATISGLIASISEGFEVEEPKVKVHGISIARKAPAVRKAVRTFLSSCEYDAPLCLSIADITDAYLDGGYGQLSSPVPALIREMMCRFGLPLDPVYTGKAWYGMLQEIERLRIGGDVLFIHTGGLPLFIDFMENDQRLQSRNAMLSGTWV